MDKEKLKEDIRFEKYALSRLVDMAKRMGNKDWCNNYIVKDKLAYIKELEAKLGE